MMLIAREDFADTSSQRFGFFPIILYPTLLLATLYSALLQENTPQITRKKLGQTDTHPFVNKSYVWQILRKGIATGQQCKMWQQ